jgi:hypothetical protein
MKTTGLILGGLGALLMASTVASAQAANTVHVRCNIASPAGGTAPVTIAAQIYRVSRDSFGLFLPPDTVQTTYATIDPDASKNSPITLDADLELGSTIEYEFKVVVLDDQGRERADGRYLFVSQTAAGELLDDTVPLHPGQPNELSLKLRWVPAGAQAKSNFLQVASSKGQQDLLLSLYVNDATTIKTLDQ